VADAFLDTNVVLYLMSADARKADRAEALLADGGVVSVQVLNEVASVARRKLDLAWPDLLELLTAVRASCRVEPLTTETHDAALAIAQRHQLNLYDALVVASAAAAGCTRLYTEDLQHGQRFGPRLRVVNPFLS
jgi:predicted nucleic acid-binding protein